MRIIVLAILFTIILEQSWAQVFTEIDPGIYGVNQGNVMWGDYDKDGDLDAFVFGSNGNFGSNSGLFRNDGGSFVEVYSGAFTNLLIGDSDWGDFDNDGDLDIVISGSVDSTPLGGRTIIYENTGSGFSPVFDKQINGFIGSAVAWGDYDKDGDLDLAIGGEEAAEGSNKPRNIEIYENTGTGFKMVYQEINKGVSLGSVDWGDYDKDGDLDLLITGFSFAAPTYRVSSIIDNTTDGFLRNTQINLIGVGRGSGEWGDYDNDGDLDILLNGSTYVNYDFDRKTLIYQNNQNQFQLLVLENALIGTDEGEAKWGDIDGDGDLDVMVIGRASDDFGDLVARIYKNTGNGFVEHQNLSRGVRIGSFAFGDYDNDGDLDIFLTGQDANAKTISRIYINSLGSNTFSANASPTAPINLAEEVNSSSVVLSWNESTDSKTPQTSLTYNIDLRIIGGDTIVTSQSSANGLRKIVNRGNVGFQTNYQLELGPGDYVWQVQAIDNSFQGSVFSSENMFHINYPPIITGVVAALSTPKEIPLTITISDLLIEDPDNVFPDDFSLMMQEGENYSTLGNEILPNKDFSGTLYVPISVHDGTDESEPFVVPIEVNIVLANNDKYIDGIFLIYPNPITDKLTIDVENATRAFDAKIFDVHGSLLYSITDEIKNGRYLIDFSPFKNGVYVLRIAYNRNVDTFKLIK